MSASTMTMMTTEEIETEFGWCEDKIRALLRFPDSIKTRRCQHTHERYELYGRDRVLAASQTAEGRVTQREWDETKRGALPSSGWTTRLGDIARPLGITAVAVGRLLEQLGYRSGKRATARALTTGCGKRRWDGNLIHYDWHLDGVVAAIRLAAQAPGNAAIANALAAAIAKQQGRERLVARKRKQDEEEVALWQEEEAVMTGLQVELQALRGTDPGMSLLDAVEYVTSDPGQRIALYRLCSPEDRNIRFSGMGQDDHRPLEIVSSVANDLAFLQRRAEAEGFKV
jgi:hypothetical protein